VAINSTDPRTTAATLGDVQLLPSDVFAVTVAFTTVVTVDFAVAIDDPGISITGGGKLGETTCAPPVSLKVPLFELQQARALLS